MCSTLDQAKSKVDISNTLIFSSWLIASNFSSIDIQLFSGAVCYTDHCLVVAKVKEILAVIKQAV